MPPCRLLESLNLIRFAPFTPFTTFQHHSCNLTPLCLRSRGGSRASCHASGRKLQLEPACCETVFPMLSLFNCGPSLVQEAEVFGYHFFRLSPSSNAVGLVTAPPFRKHFLTSHQQFLLLLLGPAGAGRITLKGHQETKQILEFLCLLLLVTQLHCKEPIAVSSSDYG